MFTKKTPAEKTRLDEAIDSVLTDMSTFTAETDEYTKCVDQLTKLYALKDAERPKKGVSPEVWLPVAGNLAGIVVIVGYEHAHVVASKALTLLPKLR